MPGQIPENGGAKNPSVDGVGAPAAAPKQKMASVKKDSLPPAQVQKTKAMLLVGFGSLYVLYAVTCAFFLSVLPSTDQNLTKLVPVATAIAGLGAFVFLGTGMFLLSRIMKSDASVHSRQWSLLRVIGAVVPGLALSIATPLLIMREPAFPIDITDPTTAEDFVAPVAVTFSAERAATILRGLNLKPLQYQWDTDGDGTVNDTTVLPTTTAVFERQGVYTVSLTVQLEGNQKRKLTRRLVIPQAVFSVNPPRPVVERPVKFSVAHLLADVKQLKEVQWDFSPEQGDEEKTTVPEVVHTYYAKGRVPVSATVLLSNNTQIVYRRTITVDDPPPLPFPVTLVTEPQKLVGPAPFGAIFRVVTDEPIKEISWVIGDGKEERGADLRRIAKSFDQAGAYPVTVRVRSTSGQLAELNTLVRVTERLQISDLTFEGNPPIQANATIKGEAPLNVQLTPKTSLPLIQFSWEDPEGDAAIQGSTISKIYRKPGSYNLTLIAEDPDGKVLRQTIPVQVDPPSAQPVITMKPDGGAAPLTVTFDASQTYIPPGQQIAGFEWSFGDEGPQEDPVLGAALVEHTYKTAGEFVATLRVVMSDGKDYKTQKTIIVRRPPLGACIQASRTTVQAGKGVAFDSACSIGIPVKIEWDVRSDSAPDLSLAQSPEAQYVHVFDAPGTYTVTLTITDQFGNVDSRKTSITVTP
jgi:PKD repeat protein